MLLDLTKPRDTHIDERLRKEIMIWLSTVRPDGRPHLVPVWFLWDGDDSILVYSRPDTPKLRNIERQPRVSLNLDGDGRGGDIVVLTGRAEVVGDAPSVPAVPEYVRKYARAIEQIGMTPESMGAAYSTVLRVTPTKLRGN